MPEDIRKQERTRLAYDLHDGPGRRLVESLRRLELCERELGPAKDPIAAEIHAACAALHRSLDEMRNIIYQYRNSQANESIHEGLKRIVNDFQKLSSAEVQISGDVGDSHLSSSTRSAAYAVTEEALFNAWRHGSPTHITISAEEDAMQLRLAIHDNGGGFDLEVLKKSGERGLRMGLMGIRERVEACGGALEVRSEPGKGVTVEATFPTTLGTAVRNCG